MKKVFLIYLLLLTVSFLSTSCFKIDEKLASKQASVGNITFQIPDAALPAPPAGQPQLTQPDLNVVSGGFSIVDDLNMTIYLTGGLTNVKIQAIATADGKTTDKATFSSVSESVNWIYPINTLAVDDKAPATGTSVVLQFVASNADNTKTANRVFSATILDPFVLKSTNPTTAFADSTISLAYTVPALTTMINANKVELYAKRGKNGVEALVSTKTYAAKTVDDKISYKMPSEIPGQDITKLDTMFFRLKATFENNRSVTKSTTVRFTNVPLSKTTTGIVLSNPAGTNASKSSFDFGTLAYNKSTDGVALKDFVVTVAGLDLGFSTGAGNATRYVKSTNTVYSSTTISYQQIRDAFNAGSPVTSATDIFLNDVYIVEIDGGTGSAKYCIFKVTAVALSPLSDNNDSITIDIKSK